MASKMLLVAALAASVAVVLVGAAPIDPCSGNPSQPGYVTLAPSFNPALADFAVSTTADCLAQDGSAIRPGYLVTSGGSAYCCLEHGTATELDPPPTPTYQCTTGCAFNAFSFNSFFVDDFVVGPTKRCYQRCFETPATLCGTEEIAYPPSKLVIDATTISTKPFLVAYSLCPNNNNPTQTSFIDRTLSGTPATGYALTMDYSNCLAPDAICTSRGIVVGGTCQLNSCGSTTSAFVYISIDAGLDPQESQFCYHDCYIPAQTCFGYLANLGGDPYVSQTGTAVDLASCSAQMCSLYDGYSFEDSGIISCF